MAEWQLIDPQGNVISKAPAIPEEMLLDPDAFNYSELGKTGLKHSDGVIYQDFVPKLRTLRERVRTFNEMLRDPVVGAVMFMIENTARQVSWEITPASSSDVDRAAADFLESQLYGMSHTFQDFLSEALSMIPFGFSIHEIVYKKMKDGKIGWKKLAPRGQETVDRWILDDHDGIHGFIQKDDWSAHEVSIPIEKLLLFRPGTRRNNPEGVSGFQSAYRPWYFKKKIEIIEAIGIERNLAGYPVLSVPMDVFAKNEGASMMRAHAEQIVSRIRRDEQMGAVLPPGWKLQLISSEGSSTIDTDRVIQRLDVRMSQSVLSDMILMGHSGSSSFALAEVKGAIFAQAFGAWMNGIQEVMNRYATPRLFALNQASFPGMTGIPMLVHGPISNIDPLRLANILFRLANIDLFNATTQDEQKLRVLLGFPNVTEEERSEAQERRAGLSGGSREGRMDNSTRLASPNQDDPGNRV